MTRYQTVSALACLTVLLIGGLAHAKPKVAVLGLELATDNGKIDSATSRVATTLTLELRRYAALGRGPFQLAPNSNKDLLELKLLNGCESEGRVCMAAIGRSVGAERLLYGRVKRRSKGYQITLNLLNVSKKSMEQNTTDLIPIKESSADGLRQWARALYNRLTGIPNEGILLIRANVDSGIVSVNGKARGELAGGTARIPGLPEGVHKVVIESRNHEPYTTTVNVIAGQTERLNVALDVKVTGGVNGGVRPGGTSRALFWTSAVLTAAGGVGILVSGISVGGFEEDKSAALERYNQQNDPKIPVTNDVCQVAKEHPNSTNVDIQAIVSACDSGQSRAQLTNIFIGATIATGLAASYFFYRGYIAAGTSSSKERSAQKKKARSRLVVTPTVSPSQIGAGIEIEF